MSISGISPGSRDLAYSGLYLPSIGFGYLYIQQPAAPVYGIIDFYLLACISSLISGVVWHEFVKALSGPPGRSSNPISETTAIQRIGYTIVGIGNPSDYPGSYREPLWSTDNEIPLSRYIIALLFLFSTFVLFSSFVYTGWHLTIFAVENSTILPGAIVFLQLTFVLQTLLGDLWPNTYILDDYPDPSMKKKAEQFSITLWDDDGLEIIGGRYDLAEGGVFKFSYETKAETAEQERSLMEQLIVAYAGIILPDEFPCQEFQLTVYEDGNEVGTYTLDADRIQEFQSGEVEMGVLVDEAVHSMDFAQNPAESEKQ